MSESWLNDTLNDDSITQDEKIALVASFLKAQGSDKLYEAIAGLMIREMRVVSALGNITAAMKKLSEVVGKLHGSRR